MRDEVVALENKAYRVVAVRIPVAVGERSRRFMSDVKLAGGVTVKSADDIEKRSLAAAGGTEYRNKLIRTERQRDFMKRSDVARRVHLLDF